MEHQPPLRCGCRLLSLSHLLLLRACPLLPNSLVQSSAVGAPCRGGTWQSPPQVRVCSCVVGATLSPVPPAGPGNRRCRPTVPLSLLAGGAVMGDGGAVMTDACFLLLGEKGGCGRWLQLPTPISKYLVTAGLRESASARASKAAFQSAVSSCSPPQRCCDAQLLGRANTSHGGGQRGAPGSALQVPVLPVSLCMTLGM